MPSVHLLLQLAAINGTIKKNDRDIEVYKANRETLKVEKEKGPSSL